MSTCACLCCAGGSAQGAFCSCAAAQIGAGGMRSIAQALLAPAPPNRTRDAPGAAPASGHPPARQPRGAGTPSGRRLDPAQSRPLAGSKPAGPGAPATQQSARAAGAVLESDDAHRSACRPRERGAAFDYRRDCHRCLYLRNESKWLGKAGFACNGDYCTWLRAKRPGEAAPWAVGCFVCARAARGSKWARCEVQKPTMANIAAHTRCKAHAAALAAYCGTDGNIDLARRARRIPAPDDGSLGPAQAGSAAHAPSASEFAEALRDVTKQFGAAMAGGLAPPGAAMAGGLTPPAAPRSAAEKRSRDALLDVAADDAVDRRAKRRKLVYCLAEALRSRHREAARKACTMTIMEDKKGASHCVRFACVNESLEVHRGILGLEECCSNAAEASAKSTMAAYVAFCTPGYGAPFSAGSLTPRDDALLAHMRKITEVGVADGLQAAQNALARLRDEGFAPGLGAPIRDVAHAGQSLYKRPWERMSAATNDFLQSVVAGKDSAASVVQNSDRFRQIFAEEQARTASAVSTVFSNLGTASHRFASHQSRLERIALGLKGFLAALCAITLERKGKPEARQVSASLDLVCDANLAMLGAVADAGAEGMRFIRLFDREDTDAECTAQHIRDFRDALAVLFAPDGIAYDRDRGASAFVGQVAMSLREPIVLSYWSPDRGAISRVVGGCDVWARADILQRMREEMTAWARMVSAGLDAEFPDWHIMLSFSVFNCDPQAQGGRRLDPAAGAPGRRLDPACGAPGQGRAKDCLARIARRYDLDAGALQRQYFDVVAFAHRRWRAVRDNQQAWREAIEGAARRRRSVDALRAAACRWLCVAGSSCGVERAFSQQVRVIPAQRRRLAMLGQRDALAVATDGAALGGESALLRKRPESGALVVEAGPWATEAQRVWRATYCGSRQRLRVRFDKGGRRLDSAADSGLGPKSHARVIRLRRQVVAKAVSRGAARALGRDFPVPPKAQAELDLQASRLRARAERQQAEDARRPAAQRALVPLADIVRKLTQGGEHGRRPDPASSSSAPNEAAPPTFHLHAALTRLQCQRSPPFPRKAREALQQPERRVLRHRSPAGLRMRACFRARKQREQGAGSRKQGARARAQA